MATGVTTSTGHAAAPTQRRVAPGPRGRRLLGSLMDVRRDRIRFVTSSFQAYGDVVGFRMGPRRLFLLNHPDHARHVLNERPESYAKGLGLEDARPLLGEGLLTSAGRLWARQRQGLRPAFQAEALDAHAGAIVAATHALVERWARHAARGVPVDVADDLVQLTLDVLGRTLLRVDVASVGRAVARDLGEVTRWSMARMASVARLPLAFPTPTHRRVRRALERLDTLARGWLDERRRNARADDTDVLSLLLRDADQDAGRPDTARDQVLTLLLAGHETTAATLAWAFYLLSTNPRSEERLHEELDRVLGGRAPTAADLTALRYTRMVLDETLRLYPPVWLIPRRALEPDEIGGYEIPGGSDVLLCVYCMHRHPAVWPDPEAFVPERFAEGAAAARVPHAYLPFGSGARACLGSRFGLLEAALALATLAQRVRVRVVGPEHVRADPALTLHPGGGLAALLELRPDASA